jgi:hypothetical protein
MKIISTRSATFLTGSEIADAVLGYGFALARGRQIDLVEIPVRGDDGSSRRAQFTVGWLADASAATVAEDREELTEPDTVIDLYDKAARVGVVRARPFTPAELSEFRLPDLDLLAE